MDWVAAALMLAGNYLIIKYKSWVSFIVLGFGNLLYLIYWFIRQEWATMILVSVFLGMNVWGLIKWSKEKK